MEGMECFSTTVDGLKSSHDISGNANGAERRTILRNEPKFVVRDSASVDKCGCRVPRLRELSTSRLGDPALKLEAPKDEIQSYSNLFKAIQTKNSDEAAGRQMRGGHYKALRGGCFPPCHRLEFAPNSLVS